VGNREFIGLVDRGAEISVLSENLFNSLTEDWLNFLHGPVSNCVLSSAWRSCSKRFKKHALIEFVIGHDRYELVFMIAPHLTTDAILGWNFSNDYQVIVDFPKRCFMTKRDSTVSRHDFFYNAMAGEGTGVRPVSNPNSSSDNLHTVDPIIQTRYERHDSVKSTTTMKPELPESRADPSDDNIKVRRDVCVSERGDPLVRFSAVTHLKIMTGQRPQVSIDLVGFIVIQQMDLLVVC
jgi:hypothetical protein